MERIRLIVAEDETLLRSALVRLLGAEGDLTVLGQAANGEAAVLLARDEKPDVVLMDINMPKMDGIAATRLIKQDRPACAVCILTNYDDDASLFEALKAGATGYILKDSAPEQIAAAIRAAAAGEGFLHATVVGRVLDEFARISRTRSASKELFAELTRREMEILELLGQGLRNREIAERLYLSDKTVKNHITNILAKLHVNDRTAAALLASKHGLSDPA